MNFIHLLYISFVDDLDGVKILALAVEGPEDRAVLAFPHLAHELEVVDVFHVA